jgi:hypothetical protein
MVAVVPEIANSDATTLGPIFSQPFADRKRRPARPMCLGDTRTRIGSGRSSAPFLGSLMLSSSAAMARRP